MLKNQNALIIIAETAVYQNNVQSKMDKEDLVNAQHSV